MKLTNKNLAVKMVLGVLERLYRTRALPQTVIDGKVFMVAPRTTLGELVKLPLKKIDRILSFLQKMGVIEKRCKHYNNKKTLCIYIIPQNAKCCIGVVCSKTTGNIKKAKSRTATVFPQNRSWKNRQTQMSQAFAQNRDNKDKDIKDIKKYRENLSGSNYHKKEITSIIRKLEESDVSSYTLWKVKKACSEDSKLLEQVKKLTGSFYWQEKVRSKDGILLALVSHPEEYDYSKLKSPETLSLAHAVKLEDIENLCHKYAFSSSATNKILKKARKNEEEADRIIELLGSKYFKENVRSKENYALNVLFTYRTNFTPVDVETKKAGKKAVRILDFSDYKKHYKNLSTKNIAAVEKLSELCDSYNIPAFLKNALINIAIRTYQIKAAIELLMLPYFKIKVLNKTAYLITLLRKTKELVFAKIVNKLKNLNPLSLPVAKKTEKVHHEERDKKVYVSMEKLYKEALRKAGGIESIGEVLGSLGIQTC
ncbi:hypothetical protein [Caldicellulosiruptor morganii]|uniref:Uncharacterized protein n=1 Tax=Caldicellulosiruptor morganii TaxID=1387555 RepID=A0ABY7BPJ6_9FIRM|nr:hypothetical protein [Caldicellulosiruptor morganii]WAM33324.1 hypothetical protein OTK00_001819 [Caldicellulosiruptor morganii]